MTGPIPALKTLLDTYLALCHRLKEPPDRDVTVNAATVISLYENKGRLFMSPKDVAREQKEQREMLQESADMNRGKRPVGD